MIRKSAHRGTTVTLTAREIAAISNAAAHLEYEFRDEGTADASDLAALNRVLRKTVKAREAQ